MRYERKFIIKIFDLYFLNQKIKLSRHNFSKKYEDRYVNNIYFDTKNMSSLKDNIEGNFFREKIRVRWYGDFLGPTKQPKLEFKIKKGLMGYKKQYILNSFDLNESVNFSNYLKEYFDENNLINYNYTFSPSVVNSYRREYFQSYRNDYRITIDHNVSYYNLRNKSRPRLDYTNNENIIVELKYTKEDKNIKDLTNYLRLRLNKNSKYVNGFKIRLNRSI